MTTRLLTLLTLLVALAFPLRAQVSHTAQRVIQQVADPSPCNAGDVEYNTVGDAFKICNNAGTWVTSGGGGGTVTNSGTLTSNHLSLGAGTTVVKVDTACVTDGAGALSGCASVSTTGAITSGSGGGSTGSVAMTGATSSSAVTLTVDANTAAYNFALPAAAGAAGNLFVGQAGGTSTWSTNWTYSANALTGAASALFDMSAATGAAAFKLPVQAGAVPVANGTMAYDATANNLVAGETEGGSSTTTTVSVVRTLCSPTGPSSALDAHVITTTETAFSISCALPAAYFKTGKQFEVKVTGSETMGGTAEAITLKLRAQKAGPTNVNLITYAAATPSISVTRGWGFDIVCQVVSTGASGTIQCNSAGQASFASGTALVSTLAMPVTLDTTAAQTLQVTVTFAADPGSTGDTAQLLNLAMLELN